MSKTNDTSKLASRDSELRDDELDVVTGGIIPGESTDMGQVDTSDPARRPLGTICNVGWVSTKPVSVR
jgi:hypothetical protein